MRAAIYARFSTDRQNERSIDDQVALCRTYAEREGIAVARVYDDRGKSAASIFGRDGLITLMSDAKNGIFDVVIVEHSDRLTRSVRDTGDLFDRLQFLGIELRAVHSGGRLDGTMAGLFGLVGQMQREEGAKKVRRGLAGVIRSGRHAGGRAYGYRPILGKPGLLTCVDEEVEVVRRIFGEYVAGATPRDIACGLNRDDIPPPRGRAWNASTLNGNAARGTGILNNWLYVGRLTWNKVRMVKDPDTGRRVSRPNPEAERQIVEVPALAIVSAELFAAAQARKTARSLASPGGRHKARYLLSGLLRCGGCGGGMSTSGRDRSGRMRLRCSTSRESGTCPDPRTVYLDQVERAVVEGLRGELRNPAVLAEFVREYHAERQRLAGRRCADRSRLERRVIAVAREAERVLDMLVNGVGDQARLSQRSKDLAAEEARLRVELAEAPAAPMVVVLHPRALERYESMLSRLQAALQAGVQSGDQEASAAIRDLVDTVTIRPDSHRRGGVEVEISGRLNALLGDEAYPNGRHSVCGIVVAGEGFEPPT